MLSLSIWYTGILMLGLVLFSPAWLLWLAVVPKVRAGFFEKLGRYPEALIQKVQALPEEKRIWIHAVSVGELNAAKPLIKALLQKGYPVTISTTTRTGQQVARQAFPEHPVFYFPFDLPWILEKTLRLVRPSAILIMETEIWPNLLMITQQKGIPVLLVNGRLSAGSFAGYRRFKWFFKSVLRCYSKCLMQSREDADRITALGAEAKQVIACGNIKFDLPPMSRSPLEDELRRLFRFPEQSPVVVFASTHKGEEEMALAVREQLLLDFPDLQIVLAPRHPERAKSVGLLLTSHAVRFSPRSQLHPDNPRPDDVSVVLLDTVGELQTVFSLGTVAWMGGSFADIGGHNPLEPLNAEIPVVFGPYMDNFKDIARRVIEAHAGFQTDSAQESVQPIRELLTRPEHYQHTVFQGQKLLTANRGVTDTLIGHLESVLIDTSRASTMSNS